MSETEAQAIEATDFPEASPQPNFVLAIPAGIGAAIIGAILWAVFGYVSGMELGLIAIAVGAVVGLAIRKIGQGSEPKFRILGGACAALGWALGTVLCDVAFLAKQVGRPFGEVLFSLGASESVMLAVRAFDGMEALFLAIAVYEGWKFSVEKRA